MSSELEQMQAERDAVQIECDAIRAQRDGAVKAMKAVSEALQKEREARLMAETELATAQGTIKQLEDQVDDEEDEVHRLSCKVQDQREQLCVFPFDVANTERATKSLKNRIRDVLGHAEADLILGGIGENENSNDTSDSGMDD